MHCICGVHTYVYTYACETQVRILYVWIETYVYVHMHFCSVLSGKMLPQLSVCIRIYVCVESITSMVYSVFSPEILSGC